MLQLRDVMTRDVLTVTPETTLREAADLFSRRHISGAPVLAGHLLVGVVSAMDLLEFVASNDSRKSTADDRSDSGSEDRTLEEYDNEAGSVFFTDREPENSGDDDESFAMDDTRPTDLFNEHTIGEVMTSHVRSLPPDALVTEATALMWQTGIHRLLVLEDGHLRGIVSMSDVARVMATTS